VRKGQLLVRLSDEAIRAELTAAISQVAAAREREASARLQISVLADQTADARLTLQQSEGDTQGKVAEAEALVAAAESTLQQEQARVEEARALLEQARIDQERYARLANQGAETQQRYDVARTAYNTAKAALKSRLAVVETARRAVLMAQGKLTQARTTMLNPERQTTNINRIQTQLAQARAALIATQADVRTALAHQKLIQSRLDDLTVFSPITGVVTTRSVEPGTVVMPTRPLLRIVDLNQVYMRGYIPNGELGRIRVGQSAKVYLDNDPKRQKPFEARVAAVDAKAAFTPENIYFQQDRVEQVFGIRLTLTTPGSYAKPGMPADAEIPLP
jgi:HlyD family secretion protein